MVEAGRVGICLDEATGRGFVGVLRTLRAPGVPNIQDVWDLGLQGTTDEVLLSELSKRGFAALLTRDTSMLSASVRRDVWRWSGVSVFMCDGKWGNLTLFEIGRRLIWYWPAIVHQALEGPQGGAWRISAELRGDGVKRVLADAVWLPARANPGKRTREHRAAAQQPCSGGRRPRYGATRGSGAPDHARPAANRTGACPAGRTGCTTRPGRRVRRRSVRGRRSRPGISARRSLVEHQPREARVVACRAGHGDLLAAARISRTVIIPSRTA